jgi:hypothetical protein
VRILRLLRWPGHLDIRGTTNIKQLTEASAARNLGVNIMPAKDHAEAFSAALKKEFAEPSDSPDPDSLRRCEVLPAR